MSRRHLCAMLMLASARPTAAQEISPPSTASPTIAALAHSASTQPQDVEYTARIRADTTDPHFLTELVDHLPASDRAPSPRKFLGYISGEAGHLTYSSDVNRYMRALAKATNRVRVFSMGQSEEGREMILVAVSDAGNLTRLERYKEITGRLADPRKTNDADADKLIHDGKTLYWATGAMHSPETGSPEMLMELAYRLAVEETPFVREIRRNVITLITPVLETDGRDRVLDVMKARKKIPGMPAVYWGHYVAHDNNRDGMSLALALTRNVMKTYLEYHPTVLHDLHESVPFLYTSTGTGPYNPWIDPIVVNEWHQLAYYEINELTKRGLPGVWTHGYYDGWAPNYMFFMANGHNSIGRFYETFGNSSPETQDRTVGSQSNRDWFRPNPPLAKVKWSLRNNVNYQESALLLALHYTAEHKDELLNNFYLKSKRAVAKALTEGPAAYVLPGGEKRTAQQAELIHLLRLHGIEIHRTTEPITTQQGAFSAGSFIVRMDQPYSRMADMLLDTDYYNVNDPAPYDDTGWSLGALKNVKTLRVTDTKVLQAPMELLKEETTKAEIRSYGFSGQASFQVEPVIIVPNTADSALASLRSRLRGAVNALDLDSAAAYPFLPGSLVLPAIDASAKDTILAWMRETGGTAVQTAVVAYTRTRPLANPRIAILHTWQSTQQEGWWRIGFDQWSVPYDYIDVHTIRDTTDLRSKWDAIVIGPGVSSGQALIDGVSGSQPIPWKNTPDTPNLGGPDSSDDIRGGIGQTGAQHLKFFVESGGLLIAGPGTTQAIMDLGLAPGVTTERAPKLRAQGGVYRAVVSDPSSPVAYGYDDTLAVYFSNSPLFKVEGDDLTPNPAPLEGEGNREAASAADRRGGARGGASNLVPRPSGRGGLDDVDIVQGRPRAKDEGERMKDEGVSRGNASVIPHPSSLKTGPRVILRFAPERNLLISGMLSGGGALADRPAVVDVPVGKGHVLLFAINPMWRSETQGSYPLIFNACLHFDHLDAGRQLGVRELAPAFPARSSRRCGQSGSKLPHSIGVKAGASSSTP